MPRDPKRYMMIEDSIRVIEGELTDAKSNLRRASDALKFLKAQFTENPAVQLRE